MAQSERPYHINGDAYQENCNCYTLTPDELFLSGSVWNINKINLNEPFDYKFTLFLGCNDGDGADGIAFVLQPISTSIGSEGGGMGYEHVNPSIGVLIDTWQNIEDNDPPEDHIAIHKNGLIDHSVMNDVTAPVAAVPGGANIEDCKWHVLRIKWDPSTFYLSVEFDGVLRTSVTYNIVKEIFNSDPMVFWGFTAATGGAKNHQRVCTSLDPKFIFPADQTTCFPEPVTFIDSSISFGTIEKWFWDFGDGTTFESSSPIAPSSHYYAAPGEYQASLKILGNDGCLSEPYVKTIVMGTEPEARFTYSPFPICEGTPVNFQDSSYVEFGTINQWNWKIGDEGYSSKSPPPKLLTGTNSVMLSVKTQEGCESGPVQQQLTAFPEPSVNFETDNVCVTEPSVFRGFTTSSSIPVARWLWDFGDGNTRSSLNASLTYRYARGGDYNVNLIGYSADGCGSAPVSKPLSVFETNAFAGNDTIVAVDQPLRLNGSGGQFYQWTPSAGLSDNTIPNPVATLQSSTSFVLTAYTDAGCATSDTVSIKVYKGPSFYVPSAFSPNNDGVNDDFRFIAVGMSSIDQFEVFNRYGQKVYSSTQVMKGWNGKVNGVDQPAGTYVWSLTGVDFTGMQHTKKGTVTLVR